MSGPQFKSIVDACSLPNKLNNIPFIAAFRVSQSTTSNEEMPHGNLKVFKHKTVHPIIYIYGA